MKFQPKRFVVEVKRGTNRASFTSPDASADRFSGAEAALFGPPGKTLAKPTPSGLGKVEVPSGRVLRSLVEPPPPVVEDLPPQNRRGRKPGSKNKPKPQAEVAVTTAEVERPRRGRKPGSKNRPKPQISTAFPSVGLQQTSAAAMRNSGFADDGTIWTAPKASPAAQQSPPPPAASVAAPVPPTGVDAVGTAAAPEPARTRLRLRDRSSILKRYVLDIEPRPGQPGAIRARRLARAG